MGVNALIVECTLLTDCCLNAHRYHISTDFCTIANFIVDSLNIACGFMLTCTSCVIGLNDLMNMHDMQHNGKSMECENCQY